MRVHHAPDLRVALVEQQMSRGVGRGSQVAFDHTAVGQRHCHELLRAKLVVRNSARLDDQDTFLPVDAAGVAERQGNQPSCNERLVGAPHLVPKSEERPTGHHPPPLSLEPAGQTVIGLIPADLVLEGRHPGGVIDEQELDARHLGEVGQRLDPDRLRQDSVMSPAPDEPRL